MAANDVTEPAVQALIAAINAGDREAFFAALTPARPDPSWQLSIV
jgi:hypothetical protein